MLENRLASLHVAFQHEAHCKPTSLYARPTLFLPHTDKHKFASSAQKNKEEEEVEGGGGGEVEKEVKTTTTRKRRRKGK